MRLTALALALLGLAPAAAAQTVTTAQTASTTQGGTVQVTTAQSATTQVAPVVTAQGATTQVVTAQSATGQRGRAQTTPTQIEPIIQTARVARASTQSPLVLEIAVRRYVADNRMSGSAADSGTDKLESYVWVSPSLCGLNASSTAPATVPGVGWHFTGQVLSSSPGQLAVRVEWQRLWENGARVSNGPSGTREITLRNGERVELDRVLPTATSSCGAVEAKLEAAVVDTPAFRLGVLSGQFAGAAGRGGRGGARGGVGGTGVQSGAVAGGVGRGTFGGTVAGTSAGAAVSGARAGGRGGVRGGVAAGATTTTGRASTSTVTTGAGRGAGGGAGRGTGSADVTVAGGGGRGATATGRAGVGGGGGRGTSPTATGRVGGVSGGVGFEQGLQYRTVSTGSFDAELWLVHRQPDGTETVQQQTVRFGGSAAGFRFPPVQVNTSKGVITLDITGRLQSFVGTPPDPDQPNVSRYVFVRATRASEAGSREEAQRMMVTISRRARATGQNFLDITGGSSMAIEVPTPNDVLSFEFPALQKATEDLLKGHLFSLRVRVTGAGR